MKKLFCILLIAGLVGFVPIASKVFAGEKANVVVTDSPGKELVIKSVTITSGSATVASGLGTVTAGTFMPSTTSTGTTTAGFEYTISGANITFYAYNLTGATSTSDYVGTAFIWGTP